MKILILSFYFPPDLSAGSFRISALVEALVAQGPADLTIDVLTTMPNRYKGMEQQAPGIEERGKVAIRRFALPAHDSGMKDQSFAFLSYARQVRQSVQGSAYDLVFATSSRLMTAALGAQISRQMKAPLYLDIRDLFTDTMKDVLPSPARHFVLPMIRKIERHTFRSASRINVVSAGFSDHVSSIVPNQEVRVFTNGIDPVFLEEGYKSETPRKDELALILYAGNIGEGQGLHNILPAAAKALTGRAMFKVIGGGGRRPHLEKALSEQNSDNVTLLPPVPRKDLLGHYRDADILFLHLNDYAAFRKVLPSKIFEYAATGKPLLAGVSGYAAAFLKQEVEGAEVFDPCDTACMEAAFNRLLETKERFDRSDFLKGYGRTAIMAKFARDILDME